MSARFKTAPSSYLRITEPHKAYCLDGAAHYLLLCVEQGQEPPYFREMTQREKDKKHQSSLDRAWARLKGKK